MPDDETQPDTDGPLSKIPTRDPRFSESLLESLSGEITDDALFDAWTAWCDLKFEVNTYPLTDTFAAARSQFDIAAKALALDDAGYPSLGLHLLRTHATKAEARARFFHDQADDFERRHTDTSG